MLPRGIVNYGTVSVLDKPQCLKALNSSASGDFACHVMLPSQDRGGQRKAVSHPSSSCWVAAESVLSRVYSLLMPFSALFPAWG